MSSTLICRSNGVLFSPFGTGSVLYDLLTDRVLVLGPIAGWIMASAPAELTELVDAVMREAGMSRLEASAAVRGHIADLTEAGLLDRSDPWVDSDLRMPPAGPTRNAEVGTTQAVLDHRLAFRSSDASLLRDIDRRLQVRMSVDVPTVIFDVEPDEDGAIVLQAADEWRFPSRDSFFVQLPGVINDFAAHSHRTLVLHAGAVRTPDGRLIVIPGAPDAGKSTLTAAMVQAGCAYLGDELICVRADTLDVVGFPRALVLDAPSRQVLGLHRTDLSSPHVRADEIRSGAESIEGDAGRVSELIMPTFDPNASDAEVERLGALESLRTLLPTVMNLVRCGGDGWRTLCQLAEQVTVTRVTHPNSLELANQLLRGGVRS